MFVTRIVCLADGEELISFESGGGERARSVLDDPRKVLLAHRQSADETTNAPAARSARFGELLA